MRTLLVSVFALLAVAAAGCGATCEDICKKQNACSGAKQKDCASFCSNLDKIASNGGCSKQKDAVIDCSNSHSDKICTANDTSCQTEGTAFGVCADTYCAKMPTPAECAALQ
jgi:hypothetical protein